MLEEVPWLRRARVIRGLTARQLADEAGLSLSLIQQIEAGSRSLTASAQEKITNVLGFAQDELPLDYAALRACLEKMEEDEDYDNPWCLCHNFRVGKVLVPVRFERLSCNVNDLNLDQLAEKDVAPMSIWAAKKFLDSEEVHILGTLMLQGYKLYDKSGFSFEMI